jgi:hypothetical protein
MAKGYMSRLLSHGVSRHTTAPTGALPSGDPLPELQEIREAEMASRIYRQRWVSRSAHGRGSALEFDVLAFSPAHAREVGSRRLEREFGAGALGDAVLAENRDLELEWRPESVAACMAIEPASEREDRRARYARSGAMA